MKVLLASSSRRRELLLKKIIPQFEIIAPREPNHIVKNLDVREQSARMAQFKAQWALLKNPSKIIIGADTLVDFEGEKIGKPKNAKEAKKFLEMFSSKSFLVHSSVCICKFENNKQKEILLSKSCKIKCKNLSKEQIDTYIRSKKWIGKAGGFNILQKPASKWFSANKEDIYAIVGLDIKRIEKEMKKI